MIKCALNKEELEYVYGLTKQSIQAKLNANNPFNVDSYMKYLYERIQKVSDKDRAAQFLAFTPAIIESVVLNNFIENIDQIEGYDKISILKVKWADPQTAIKNVVNTLDQTKTNLIIARLIREQAKGIIPDKNESKFDYNVVFRYKALNILSTTLPAFKPGATKFEKEVPDVQRRNINDTITAIANTISLEDTVLKHPNYQGVNIKLKAVNLSKFVDGTYSEKKLDGTTQSEIARSLDIQNPLTKGKPKAGIIQVQDRVIVLVTDEKGNPLSFDSSNNIVAEESSDSTYVYQMMRSIRKDGSGYSIRDIYNLENKVLSSSEIATIRSEESNVNYKEALQQVNSEFKEYYTLKNAALKEDLVLDFIGMTDGISIDKTTKKTPLNVLIDNKIITDKTLETIRTLTVPENGIAAGRATIVIEGDLYQLDRSRMSEDLAIQIQEVLFSEDFSIKEKTDFYEQFIPNKYITNYSKRHDIVREPVTNELFIKVYDKVQNKKYPRNLLFEISINSDGIVFENGQKVSESKKVKLKKDFKDALTNTYPDGNSIFIHYSEDHLQTPYSLDLYENGELKRTVNYYDFIKSHDPLVFIVSSETGYFNKQILFQRSTDTQLNNITEALPINKRFSQLKEDEYLGNLLLKETPDGKSVLKDEYKGKFIYSTVGLFSNEVFQDTDVVHTNDITVDLISSIQMGNGEVFRERNEDESIEAYIFAFSKAGYKTTHLDPAVTNRIKQLTESGVTVVTETSDRIKDVDLVVLGDRNNPGVESYSLKDNFFKKELEASVKYIQNLQKEPASISISPYVNKKIVIDKATSVDTDKPNDPNEDWELLRNGKLNSDKLSAADIKRADTFWTKSAFGKSLQKSISLNKAVNLVNSDAYANFVISGATLMNPDIKGTINIDNSKGSMVDLYHESFHAFTQLYLTPQQKIDLYEEVLDYTDTKGNKPYEGKSYLEIEEILAEDFRSYMKKNVAKPNSPMRNSIFRKIVQMLQKLLGKIIPNLKNVQLDIMSVPAVKELYENLNFGSDKYFNQYEASVDNAIFFELERGIKYVEKINNESYKRTALSKTDSDLISSSIDSIISDLIDARYDKEMERYPNLKGTQLESYISKIKGLSLTALLEPKHRALTYKKVLDKLKERLTVLNKEYNKSVGKVGISKINTFKLLKDNAVATLKTESGIHKYVLLKSQIDSFKDFDSYFKRGTRVKGEEWKGIKIVGDYFTHSIIKDNSREKKPEVPAQIIIVSRIEDAKVQYDNYVKGKAKEYTGIKLNAKAVDSDLTYDQENLLDNIRILENAIDQFGDPNYIINDIKPTGVIAYHLLHSDFEINKIKYFAEEEVPQENSKTPFEEDFQKSLYDLAEKEVIYILKSLHKIENGKTKNNKLGFKERADFRKVWNTLFKVIGGVQSRQEMFDIIKEEAKNFPELEQLWKFKLPSPRNIQSTYAMDISSSFWHTFSKPSVKAWQLTTNISEVYIAGDLMDTSYDFIVNESTIELNKILSTFENRFKISKNKYMLRFKDQPAVLDLPRFHNDFIDSSSKVVDKLGFLRVLGFQLDNTKQLEKALTTKQASADINNLVLLIKDLYNITTKPINERSVKEKKLLKRFVTNPIGTLRNNDFMKNFISELPSFKNIETLRNDSIVRNLGKIQANFGFDTPGDTIVLPDGNNAYTVANHSAVTSIVLGINALDDLEEAYVLNEHLSYLNPYEDNGGMPYNPLALRNKVLNTMFPNGTKRDFTKEMEFVLLTGTELRTTTIYEDLYNSKAVAESSGINTGDLTPIDKLFQEYNMLLSKGVGEFIRHSEKKSAFGIKLDKRKEFNGIKTGTNKNLWIDIDLFKSQEGDGIALEAFILDYIASEFDRIQYFEQNEGVLETTTGYNRTLSNGRKAGLSFVAMDSLISEPIKEFLYKEAKKPNVTDIIDVLKNSKHYQFLRDDVLEYFEQKTLFIKNSLGSNLRLNPEFAKYDVDTLAKAYTYNDFINKLEMSNLINGDVAQFENLTKRSPGSSSNGDGFLSDINAQKFINGIFQGKNVTTYANTLGIEDFNFDGTLNTGVIKDPKRKSIYLKEMQEAWTENYLKAGLTKSETSSRVTRDSKAYKKMLEADGAAYLTIDAYRVLRKLGNKWSLEQENLYKDIVAGNDVSVEKVYKFFPVYKLHNYGPLMNSKIATTSMFKFAVAPIIPSIAKPGTELYKLHTKMLKSGIQMVTFKSGSKVASLTSKSNTEADDIFEKLDDLEKLNRTDKYVEEDDKKAPIKNNKIHLKYLKDVTSVADKLHKTITVGTQSRVVVESQLYSMGDLINPKNKKISIQYKKAVKNLTDVLETELLDEIGFTINEKGTYIPYSKGSLEKLTRMIRTELDSKGSPVQLQNIIDVSVNGSLKIDFSIHPEAQVVEQILVNRISKSISAQKTKGESDVQVPNTFYNGVWNSELEQDLAIIKNELEIQKYLGTNNLPFYRRGEIINKETGERASTHLAKVAIPLNGDFVNLLNLEDPDNPGNIIGTRKRLNELLKDTDWMKEHGQKVTITGPRIPTDDTNLIEGFEVWHFIDASAGSTAVVPTEIVAKAGSDFDVDKLFFSFPNINEDGSLPKTVLNFDSQIKKLRKEKKSIKKLINQQKRFNQNELIRTGVEILKLPETYSALTKPANTYLFKDQAKLESKSDIKGHSSLTENPTKFFETEYNNLQHELLLGGNIPVSIFAKYNKQHILYKSIGAKMPKKYFDNDYLIRKMKMRFPHNLTPEGNISISSITNVDNVNIGEIFSHGLQGVLDRGNDSFPVRAGISKESLPVVLRMIESGVSLPQVIKFVQQPLIEDYLKKLAESKGILSQLKDANINKRRIVDQLLVQYIDSNAISFYNKKSFEDAKEAMKRNPNKMVSITAGDDINSVEVLSKDFNKFIKEKNIESNQIKWIQFDNDLSPIFAKYSFKNPNLLYKTYHLGEYFWNKTYAQNIPTGKELRTPQADLEQVALLFEFLNVERQSQGMENFEMNFNPDTGLLLNIEGVVERKNFIKSLYADSRIDKETLDNYLNDSIVSSMYKTKIFIDIVGPQFALRLNKGLSEMLGITYFNNRHNINLRYEGNRIEAREKYANAFNNGVIDYIYQNILSNYVDNKTGLPVTLPEEIRKRKVNKKKLLGDSVVVFNNKTVNIDLDQIKTDYKKGLFFTGNDVSGKDTFDNSPFPTEESYIRYIIEREYFREVYKEHKDKSGFEERISKRALATSFNVGYIKGDAGFGSIKYSYTKDIMEFIEDPSNKTIVQNFPVLQHLKPSFYMASKGYQLLELDNKTLIDNDIALDYSKQLKQLGDPIMRIVSDNPIKDAMISDLFKNFSLMAIYQQGTGKSGLNFIKALNPNTFVDVLKIPTIQFQKSVFKDLSKMPLSDFKKEMSKRNTLFNFIADSILDTSTYKQLLTSPGNFLGSIEAVKLKDLNKLSNLTDEELYRRYKDAIVNKVFDNAMSDNNQGTAILNEIEIELLRRNLPLIPTQSTSKVKPTINLSKEWKGDLESRPVYTAEGVNTMRTSDAKSEEHFGNPFSEAGYGDTVKVNSIGAAVEAYKAWLNEDNLATTKDFGLDPKEFLKKIILSAGGKPTRKGMFAIDGQYYYIPDISIMSKPYGYDAFINIGNDEIYLGSSKKGYTDFVSNDEYPLADLNYEQREWILDQINQGKLDGAILLYAGKLAARGEGMHPTALAEVVEELRLNPNTKVKVVNEVYDKIDEDSYSISLNYKGRDYNMVISRDGEIVDPSYYNPETLMDVDVKSNIFKFTKEDIKNIFLEIEQPPQPPGKVKEGVSEVFEIKPELANIGTQEQYSEWINYLLTKGKLKGTTVKDILYHGTYEDFEEFSKEKRGNITGLGSFKDKKTGEEVDSDTTHAFFFTDNKINAISYSFKGREGRIRKVKDALGDILMGEGKNEAVKFIKSIPYYNKLIEAAKNKGKSQEEIKDLLRKELKKVNIVWNKGSAQSFGNSLHNHVAAKNEFESFLKNISRFKNNDLSIKNRFGDFNTYNASYDNYKIFTNNERYEFVDVSKGPGGTRFFADEVDNKVIEKFFKDALKAIEQGEIEAKKKMKKQGYVEKTLPVLLNLKNPLIHDYEESLFTDKYKGGKNPTEYVAGRQVKKALKENRDGVIYENIVDPYLSTTYGVFETENIYTLGGKEDMQGFKNFVSTQQTISKKGQLNLFDTIDPVLENFYNNLSKEQLDNPNLPSITLAQEFYTDAPHAYKNINEYIESLKCL